MKSLIVLVAIGAVACGGQVDGDESELGEVSQASASEALPYGYRSRLAFCERRSRCDADVNVKACAKAVEDAPIMTRDHFERCVSLAGDLDCAAAKDTGVWISTKFACGH
jgi:hypothetical protein